MELDIYYYVIIVFLIFIAITGIPGNLLIIGVFGSKKKTKKTSTDVFIIGLAITDMTFCLITPLNIYLLITKYDIQSLPLCFAGFFSTYFSVYNSMLMCLAIAFDRYLAISRPHKKLLTPVKATFIVVTCMVASTLINLAYLPQTQMFSTVQNISFTEGNETHFISTEVSTTCFVRGDTPSEAIVASLIGVSYCIWLSIIGVLYVKIYILVRKLDVIRKNMGMSASTSRKFERESSLELPEEESISAQHAVAQNTETGKVAKTLRDQPHKQIDIVKRNKVATNPILGSTSEGNQVSRSDRQDTVDGNGKGKPAVARNHSKKTTKMLFIVTFVTFITWVPTAFAFAIGETTGSTPGESDSVNHREGIEALMQHLFFINHASNPVIYGLVNYRFRQDCQTLLKKICLKH